MENSGDNNGSGVAIKDRRPEALGDLKVLPDELICYILENLTPRDVGRLACVSSVMYIFCNEEPLWMSLCVRKASGLLQYKGSWKKTTLQLEDPPIEYASRRPLHFDGFYSPFLYRRFYRCNTSLDAFSFDNQVLKARKVCTLEEFKHACNETDVVLLSGLADTWPARTTWTVDQLSMKYGDTTFKISQKGVKNISMKFNDYVSYMKVQRDEDPLYIFDAKFGEAAPGLLKDYSVPHLFQEDLFAVLDRDQRPSYQWFIVGPERSGASWHVDPALTSAWNTLLSGRKRWALYPPGRVPLGVTVHVNDEDGDVNIESPSSLQWWLDFYPLLADDDKPIECTQHPGETIFVPSGWWHCVLNLETTIAVTQNFVDSNNFEFVCLDMAPGYRHKGICRAGLLALDEGSHDDKSLSYPDMTRKEKRVRINSSRESQNCEEAINDVSKSYNLWKQGFSYDISFLEKFLDEERDHYNFPWSSGNCIGQREMREWLYKLWIGKPEMRELVWKGACLAVNAGKWLERLEEIRNFHDLPPLKPEERLPVGTGSNPVYLMADCAVKIFVEDGLESSLYGLGTELEFYSLLSKANSRLKSHIPEILASGILYLENGLYKVVSWGGKGVPDVIGKCNLISQNPREDSFPFGIWSKKQFEFKRVGKSVCKNTSDGCKGIWPYVITKRCKGKIFAQLRDTLSWEDMLNLASFLGEQLRNLHLLPYPPFDDLTLSSFKQKMELKNGRMENFLSESNIPVEWEVFIRTLNEKKKDVASRLTNWGDPIPGTLIEKVDEYIPDDFAKFLDVYKDENGQNKVCKPCSWIHSDIMDDNVHMVQCSASSYSSGNAADSGPRDTGSMNGFDGSGEEKSWRPTHILDFSDLSIGDPIYDLIPIHLDVFRGDSRLLKQLLEGYKLPLLRRKLQPLSGDDKFARLSYHTMCYCILHEENVLGAIFGMWKGLRMAKSWEEVELKVWGELNNYNGFL
ncbi:F-box protein At1g78280 isoform X1 [Mangifera indica]|uniref:F-box protein At1g78280 isoform X1 n=1 Tax=Mangifera indica TaxID=29780 RepID=UPI001CFC03BE|nr:F-box protein At1g78280 isoform X1 [Mangifera indica]